jgi:hypothetical protein
MSAVDVFHPVSRRDCHVTLLARVSLVGDALTPMIISQVPVCDSLSSRGPRQDEEPMVRQRNPAEIDEELFYEYPVVPAICKETLIATDFEPYPIKTVFRCVGLSLLGRSPRRYHSSPRHFRD